MKIYSPQSTVDGLWSTVNGPQKIIWGLCVVFCVLFLGCKKKEEVKTEEPPPLPPPLEVSPPKYETYQYLDMGRRDPFIPLRGPGGIAEKEIIIEEAKTEESPLEGWAILGFVWDKGEKMGVIKGQQETYLFSQGTLFDRNGEPVPDIKAKIKDNGILLVKNKKEIFLKIEEKDVGEENVIE